MNILNIKDIVLSLMFLALMTNPIFSACGSCPGDTDDSTVVVSKKTSALVTTVPESGSIEGFVISSCGKCNFDYKKRRGCSLTIKIEDTVYPVQGIKIHDHGDPHSGEGFCNSVRVAYVSGEIKKNVFHADSFTLIESPK